MSQRKNSKQEQKKSRAELRKQLARDLESIITNPETPAILHNAISDCMTDFEQETEWHKADYIERALENYARIQAKRKGGARA